MRETSVLSVTEAARRGVPGLMKDAAYGDLIVERHGFPVAAVVSMDHLAELREAVEQVNEATLLLARLREDVGHRVGLDDVFAQLGLDRSELQAELDAPTA